MGSTDHTGHATAHHAGDALETTDTRPAHHDPDAHEDAQEAADTHLRRAYHRTVLVGEERLRRTWPNLAATGFVGGMDVGVGVLGLLVVRAATGSAMLGALAFSAGFITLVLARSELFTENFLVPVTVVITERRGVRALLRLWGGTLAMNWAGGAVVMLLIVTALPEVEPVAVEVGRYYPELGTGLRAMASAVLGGVLITLMTWIERATQDVTGKLAIAVITAFLLTAPPLAHTIVGALEMMAGLFTGDAPYSWLDALGAASWAIVGNLIGGVGLVTLLRLIQVGARAIREESDRTATGQR